MNWTKDWECLFNMFFIEFYKVQENLYIGNKSSKILKISTDN